MFEARVLQLLRQYLGEYVHGLSAEALKISVWQGDVVLKDLQLKAEALNSLKLPITVKAGFLGSVTLKVPWNRLGKEPVIVLLDQIFILTEPAQDERSFKEDDKERLLEAKRRQIEEAELEMLESKDKRTATLENSPETGSWLSSLVATIVGNLKISITNVHIRYEDCVSNPGKPFSSGITLSKLAAFTIDDNGAETFVTSGALDRLHKSLQLKRFAVYHDSNSSPWNVGKNWEDMTPQEWSEVFEAGINQEVATNVCSSRWAFGRQYLLQPLDGMLQYHRRGKREKRAPDSAFQKLSLVLDEVSVTVSESQYCDGLKTLECVSRYRKRIEFCHFRPRVSVLENPHAWWVYASQAELQRSKKMWHRLSLEKVVYLCQLRRKYVQLYAALLQQNPKGDNQAIREMEKELDAKVILLWRLLAHAKVESVKSKESALAHQNLRKSSWWSFGWGNSGLSSSGPDSEFSSGSDKPEPGRLTKEEWKKINELVSYQLGGESSLFPSQEALNMLQISFDATVSQSAVRIIDSKEVEIMCGKFENLKLGLKMYPKTIECNTKLQFYGLSAPEGSLVQSVSGEGKEQALSATFVHCPLDESLDWKLSATISPCYVTVWYASFMRFMQFLRSSNAVSPDVAIETAAVLQNKLEQVTRRAQVQLQLALEEQSRFSIDLDLDAPKVRIPIDGTEMEGQTSQLLLDLGHFTLHTINDEAMIKGGAYSRFYVSGSQIAVFFVDGKLNWSDTQVITSLLNLCYMFGDERNAGLDVQPIIFPVLDRCGMTVIFDQIRVQNPILPSTHVIIQVPHLGLHFSPARYDRLLRLFAALGGFGKQDSLLGGPDSAMMLSSWHPADHAGDVRVLFWKGLGNTVAEWQSCWAALAGSCLYILESENAQTYQRCFSMSGKQVLDVPCSNVGGSEFVIAICNRRVDLQKALESSNTVIMQLKDEEHKLLWVKCLTLAIYGASAPASLCLPEGLSCDGAKDSPVQPASLAQQPTLFVTGLLHELKLSVYGATGINAVRSSEEIIILQLQAVGGKVNVLQRLYDLTVGMKLHTLKIQDKLQGDISPLCRYIARSMLNKPVACMTDVLDDSMEKTHGDGIAETVAIEDETFKDALPDFGGPSDSSSSFGSFSKFTENISEACSAENLFSAWWSEHTSFSKGQSLLDMIAEESVDKDAADFVSMQFITREIESPDYDGTDTQISIQMATLDFFCNRPTVVALIDFGTELSELMESKDAAILNDIGMPSVSNAEPMTESVIVKGLLGQGKSRVVFGLIMNVDSVRIFLNKEDGSQLAMLAQERFQMSLKVFPGSFVIGGNLGNLRVCDMSLGPHHHWGWFCDIRDPGCDSLVKLEFQSFSMDEDDFQGYDYSLSGKLSAVRIVFLYRFIQEISAYFVAMATPQAQHAIRVVDKVGGIERLIPQSDIDGLPSVRLDISLDTPIIIIPGSSASKDFMQLDLGHLQILNSFEWHGGGKDVASAVHLDVLSAEVTGVNMVVGIDGVAGKGMIQEARGLHIKVRRALRDLFRKVPEVQVDVQVAMLRGIMSDKEYLVVTECLATNIAEAPNLPPYFRNIESEQYDIDGVSGNSLQASAIISLDCNESNGMMELSVWTTTRVTVEVQYADLELCNGVERDAALARVELQGIWLGYRSTSSQVMEILFTLARLSVLDLRADTKPEMQLMLGSMADVERNGTFVDNNHGHVHDTIVSEDGYTFPCMTMLVLDLRMKPESQTIVIRMQRPRLLVVVDFLLAVGEFFVPSLGAITGKDDTTNAQNDPIKRCDHIRLTTPEYKQQETTVILSRNRQLIVESSDFDEFTYDGCGGTMHLDIPEANHSPTESILEPLIIVGPGKRLHFKNIRMKNGLRLRECLRLSCNSYCSASSEDLVILERADVESDAHVQPEKSDEASMGTSKSTGLGASEVAVNFVLDVQAVAPEFTFYDSAKWTFASRPQQERLLRAKMDFNLMYASKENDKWIHGLIKGLCIEGGSGLAVVDPLDISVDYACVKDKTNIVLYSSDIYVRLSFSLITLLVRLHSDVISTFQFGGGQISSRCTHYDRIWLNHTGDKSTQRIAIWRPKPPPGYAALSDCVTSGEAPPSQAVIALSNSYGRIRKPCGFELVWSFCNSDSELIHGDIQCCDMMHEHCQIWRPVPPPGYIALGCVAEIGFSPPSRTAVYCVRADLVTTGSIIDCIFYISPGSREGKETGFSIWRIENAVGSFFAHSSTDIPSSHSVYDLCETLQQNTVYSSTQKDWLRAQGQSDHRCVPGLEERAGTRQDEIFGNTLIPGVFSTTTAQFERMWWDKGNGYRQSVSIWRPIPPPGYAIVGDVLIEGLEPPNFGLVLRDDTSGSLAKPSQFVPRMHLSSRGLDDTFVWYPVAPAGYVSLGCVLSKTEAEPELDLVRCVRIDLVNEANVSKRPSWMMTVSKSGYSCSLWRVENQANTFLARPDLKKPPARLRYGLIGTERRTLDENLTAEMKIGRLSVTTFDDFSGLMTPLADMTVTSINLAARGHVEALNVVVVSSMAASTFNTHLETWEPLIEPFDGICKYESYDKNSELGLKVGKQVRITAANIVNLNVTSANVDALVGAMLTWQKHAEIGQQAMIAGQLDDDKSRQSNDSHICSALEENNLEKLIVENKLGCKLYLRSFELESKDCQLLEADMSTTVDLPPPKFPYMHNNTIQSKLPDQYVAIYISEARELVINDDGSGQDFLCSLRLAAAKQPLEDQKVLTQSARSRCVRPSDFVQIGDSTFATAKWNEVFLFDVPHQGLANLEVVVSNQAAKGGKGEVVGVLSLPIDEDTCQRPSHDNDQQVAYPTSLCNSSQLSCGQRLPISWSSPQENVVPLTAPKRKVSIVTVEDENKTCGYLALSMHYFTTKFNWHKQKYFHRDECRFSDIGLWVGLSLNGPWAGIRSILTLSTSPMQINSGNVALEISMQEGQKHAILRSLVTVFNNTDIALEVCVCPMALLNSSDDINYPSSSKPVVNVEEVFENQRYQPLAGWGSKWPGHLLPTDPDRWSNRDYSKCSQTLEEFETLLQPGWIWVSDWTIDKTGYVDVDGWAYGADFQSLRWPLTSTKSCRKSTFDFTRRRRWVRTQQRVPETGHSHARQSFGIIQPGKYVHLPWAYTAPQADYCVQVRPTISSAKFLWGRSVNSVCVSGIDGSQASNKNAPRLNKNGFPVSLFMLNQLEKTEEFLICPLSHSKEHHWLSMEADASILYSDLNLPIYDWRLTVNAPLKLENLLPCSAEYIAWEKRHEASLVKQDQGVVNAGESVFIYSVDTRRPVFLTWLMQGGWKPEKEVVLISCQSSELPSGFFLVHQQNGRRLRISLEHDFGGANAAAKIVRLFVPYWLCNKAMLPLAYHLVEIEPGRGLDSDTPWLMRAVKAAKRAAHRPLHIDQAKRSKLHKVVQFLEAIEDTGGKPVMFSPQAQLNRSGFLPFSPRTEDGLLSPRLGFSVTLLHSKNFSAGISFRDLEGSEHVHMKAVDRNGAYYKLSAFLGMSSERTKIVSIQPHTLFVNRLGQRIFLRQGDLDCVDMVYPNDPPKSFLWQSTLEPELLKISIDGYGWSNPFSVDNEGIMHVMLHSMHDGNHFFVRVDIQNGVTDSRFIVVFRHVSFVNPYRIENRSVVLPIRFHQSGGDHGSWQLIQPGSAVPFAWEDLRKEHMLEILVAGADPLKSRKFNIDETANHQPSSIEDSPVVALNVTVFKEGTTQVVRISDWMPSDKDLSIVPVASNTMAPWFAEQRHASQAECTFAADNAENQFHIHIELAEFGLSVVDHTPEEVLYLYVQNLFLMYATGLGSGTSRFKLRVDDLQVDNQLPLTPMPILFRPQTSGNQPDYLIKCSFTLQNNGSSEEYVYPYIGIQCPSVPNAAFLVHIHEPIIWRLHEMIQHLNLNRLAGSQTTDVAIDPMIRIGLLNTSEIRFKVSLAMSPTQRPRGVLGFWASLMTALGNTDDMPVRIAARVQEDVCMRQSALVATAILSLRKDILSHPLQLLSGVDILGNASSALGHMSKGVAALSMDKKFIRSRQKQDSKATVEGFGDGVREGAEAFGKGLFRGVTGILTKPFEGAKSSGVEGFVQGVGKGIIGVAAQPMSGVLDLLSKTTEGANAMRMKITAAITSEGQVQRRRLPRVIGGDNILRPYDEYKAQGQVLMQLAERGAIMDLFKVRGKFAMSDAYEDHFNLPKGRALIVTHRRVILLQHPTNLIVQKKPDLLKDPCTILWDVTWNDLITVEVLPGKGQPPGAASQLILHLRNWSQETHIFDSKELVRIVKCHPESNQAEQICVSIQQAMAAYGPGHSILKVQSMQQMKVNKPYAAAEAGASLKAMGLFNHPTAPNTMPMNTALNPVIGTSGQVVEEALGLPLLGKQCARLIHQADGTERSLTPLSLKQGESFKSGKLISNFKMLWQDKGDISCRKPSVSIWRPATPSGYVSVGDVACQYDDPPFCAMIYFDKHDKTFAPPEGFDLVWREMDGNMRDPLTIWMPRAPPNYVALGCVVVPDYYEPDPTIVYCVHDNFVKNVDVDNEPIWKDRGASLCHCSIWKVHNEAQTFLACRDLQSPPARLAYSVIM